MTRVEPALALNASRKAGSAGASRRDNAGCPAGVRRGEYLSQAAPAPTIAAIASNAIVEAIRTVRRRTTGSCHDSPCPGATR